MSETLYWYRSDTYLEGLGKRSKNDYNSIIFHTGKPGKGKTMGALLTAYRMNPNMDPETAICFNGKQFKASMEAGNPWTVWDEKRGLSHRTWWNEIQRAITDYLQTARFQGRNVIFAIPKAEYLDKGVRGVVTCELIFYRRGLASIYLYEPNHFGSSPEVFKHFVGEAQFKLPTDDPAWKNILHVYERKRKEWHESEFPPEAFDDGLVEETPGKRKTVEQVVEIIKKDRTPFLNPKNLNELSVSRIAGIAKCSDQTARSAKIRVQNEDMKNALRQEGQALG